MLARRIVPVVALSVLSLVPCLAGCGSGGRPSLVAAAAPTSGAAIEQLTAAMKNCLQYQVDTRADGTQLWNADYVYFYLLDKKTSRPWLGPEGKPIGQRLLASEAKEFMARNPELEARTDWGMRLARQVQEVKGDRVTTRPDVSWIDDFDVDSLIAKDAAARKH